MSETNNGGGGGNNSADIAAILRDYVPRSDYEAALEAIEAAITERDEAHAAASKHTERLTTLEKAHRNRTWRDTYSKIADELKVNPDFKDDVYDLLRLEPDADEPDPRTLRKTVEDFLGKRPGKYTAEKAAPKRLEAGEGATRGASVRPGEPEFRVTREQRTSAVWMRENQGKMLEAQRAGALVLED